MAIHLTAGSRLKAYALTTDMTSSDAGMSMWAFAEKDGFDYFVKCYLTPVYPDARGPGSECSKARKRALCEAFESRMRRIEATLRGCGEHNFLVRGVDFFREDGSYFKVTKRIKPLRRRVADLPAEQQMLVLLSAAYSIRALHENSSFIHADIKPENFVIQRAGAGSIANLIDFDAGFYIGQAPPAEELIGDQRYWAPELIACMDFEHSGQRQRPALLHGLDVFSLGLTFCEFLSGKLPQVPERYSYPGEAVLDGVRLDLPEPLQAGVEPLTTLIREMLDRNPLKRPSASVVHERLRTFNRQNFVSDTTYRKIAASWKKGLSSGARSLQNWAKARGRKPYKSASDLRVRGLKARERARTPAVPDRLRFWSKA